MVLHFGFDYRDVRDVLDNHNVKFVENQRHDSYF